MAGLTITLTEYEQQQTACVIASGGGGGLSNYSFGANRNLAKDCVCALESCGFTVVKSDLDKQRNLLDRLIK